MRIGVECLQPSRPKTGTLFRVLESYFGGSWDLVSTVISTSIGDISTYKCSYLNYNPSY